MNLFSIPAVSLAISVVICWALFALACSMIHESVVSLKAERGRFMKAYILQQLRDDINDINWGLELYRQGAIVLLTRDVRKPTDEMDPGLFATALVSAVAGSNLVKTRLQALQQQAASDQLPAQPPEQPSAQAPGQRPAQPPATQAQITLAAVKDPTLRDFKAATMLLRSSDQMALFSSLLANAELKAAGAVDQESLTYTNLLAGLQEWHQGLMQRLSLWYKKKTKQRLFWLGLLVALVLNVDSVQLFSFFNANPQASQKVIAFYQGDSAYLNNLARHIDADSKDTSLLKSRAGLDSLKTETDIYMTKMKTLADCADLPIGLHYSLFLNPKVPIWKFWKFYLLRLIGILISAFAASLGAPFWFDLLKKAYSIKSKA